jgi:outer membrane lipoprotein-sorting protein
MAYQGKAGTGRGKPSAAFEFMNMSRQQLAARYDVQNMGEETLWGGVATTHVKLVPKGGGSFKWAEAWIDEGGMPVQTKVIEKNDDSTTVRLTNMQRNANIPLEEFFLKLDSGIKIVPA